MYRRPFLSAAFAGICCLGSPSPTLAQNLSGVVTGTVTDADGGVVPGATVTVETAGGRERRSTVTDGAGRFTIPAVRPGQYIVVAALSGFERAIAFDVLVAERPVELALVLAPAPISEIVDVVASAGAGDPIETDEIGEALFRVFPLPSDRFQEALPLLPAVIRDPRGRLSFNGTRPSQSALLVNGANATDPVTGQFAMELPLSVIETVEVHSVPYSAEFGRVSAAVANVRTRAGGDDWDLEVGGLVPTPRYREGAFKGIDTATPRIQVSGPLWEGRAWLRQAASYRYTRSRVEEDVVGLDEEIFEGFDAFTQIDMNLDDRHSVTGTVSFFPSSVFNHGISAVTPAEATPDLKTGGWNLAVANQLATGPDVLWRGLFALRGFDVEARPKTAGVSRLTPDGLRGNYFNTIDRESTQLELGLARTAAGAWRGRHLVTIGAQAVSTSFSGIDRNGPIELRGADGELLTRITFQGDGVLESSDVVSSGYLQDHWQVNSRLAFDLGVRFDHDAMLGESHWSPRTAFSVALDADGRTIIKGGWGLFFDQAFLQAGAFTRFQQRVEQDFLGSPAAPAGPPIVFENRYDPDVEPPMSRVWNLEFDYRLTDALIVRVNYRVNEAFDRLIVERVAAGAEAALRLSPTGEALSREFDTTFRWTLGGRGDLFLSYSKLRATGDLNDFGELYDTVRAPLILDNEYGHQPFEVANRVLLWGRLDIGRGITVAPGIEWRDGFPYTVFDRRYRPVGPRNVPQFPSFFQADLAVTKPVTMMGREVDVGLQIYNLGSRRNPRDVINNLTSRQALQFLNSVGTSVSLRVGLGL